MASMSGKWFSISLDDPWAQRLIGAGVLVLGTGLAVTIYRQGGIKLIIEGAEKFGPEIIENTTKAAAKLR